MSKAMVKNSETGEWEDRSIEALHDAVVECCGPNGWDLYSQSDAISQQLKLCSEAGEGCDSVNKSRIDQLKDDVGDMIVCIINLCQFDINADFYNLWREALPVMPRNDKKYTMLCAIHHLSDPDCIDYEYCIGLVKGVAELHEIDPVECLGIAYDVISKRTGVMRNGTFIKSEDL